MLPAVILAGGRGSRFKELTDNVPKPMWMLPSRLTILEEIITKLMEANASKIYVTCGYLGEMIRDHIQSQYPECELVLQDAAVDTPLKAILAMREFLAGDFAVVHGDHWFSHNPFVDLLSRHVNDEVTFLVENAKESSRSGYDVQCLMNVVSGELSYIARSDSVSTSMQTVRVRLVDGCHVLPRSVFSVIREAHSRGVVSGMRDLFGYLSDRRVVIMRGIPLQGDWENINDLKSLGRTVRRIYGQLAHRKKGQV